MARPTRAGSAERSSAMTRTGRSPAPQLHRRITITPEVDSWRDVLAILTAPASRGAQRKQYQPLDRRLFVQASRQAGSHRMGAGERLPWREQRGFDAEARQQLDRWYIDHWSLWLDFKIIWKGHCSSSSARRQRRCAAALAPEISQCDSNSRQHEIGLRPSVDFSNRRCPQRGQFAKWASSI